MSNNKKLFFAFVWKFGERIGISCVQFILQIVLARILSPDHYGMLSMMIIFTSLATVFVQRGFNTALIQNKDVTEDDYSSVFWISFGIAGIIYAVLFFTAPIIADFYEMPDIISPFRVLALMLFPGAMNSVQLAKVSRDMDFRKVFFGNLAGIIVSGIIGIIIALAGGGLWALVAQNLLNILVACIVMRFMVKLKIRFICNFNRVKVLFSYGWKLLLSSLIDTLYQDIRSLFVGKKYDSGTLGYYDRGKQFPHFIINAINLTVQSVMLPAMAAEQDERKHIKNMMRNSITISSYIIFPMMAGLAGISEPLVRLILTDKWLPCVPYMQIYCFTFALYPVHSCNLQAINAIGRSDLYLKLEIIKKTIGFISLIFATTCFDSPIAIAVTGIFTSLISCFVNASPSKKMVGYSYFEQIRDILPPLILSFIVFIIVYLISILNINIILMLCIQIFVGIISYILLSLLFKVKEFYTLLKFAKNILSKKSKKV